MSRMRIGQPKARQVVAKTVGTNLAYMARRHNTVVKTGERDTTRWALALRVPVRAPHGRMPLGETTEYRLRAEECLMQARGALDFAIRMQWLALAEDWRALADSTERAQIADKDS